MATVWPTLAQSHAGDKLLGARLAYSSSSLASSQMSLARLSASFAPCREVLSATATARQPRRAGGRTSHCSSALRAGRAVWVTFDAKTA